MNYQICKNCIMDTSDPHIKFDADGICDYCKNFKQVILPAWKHISSNQYLNSMSETIKRRAGVGEYDCIIGLSGGLDSSYAAHIAVTKMGLNPLLVHIDAGWNTDQAVGNIEALVEGLQLDLYTDVVEWSDIRDMQVAFLKSGIPDQDLVQDAAFFSGLYKFARRHKIKNVITGSNFSTECCREPEEWGGYLGIDRTLFDDIYRNHGENPPSKFPLVDIFRYKLIYQKLLGMKMYHPLNSVRYIKSEAEQELGRIYGWRSFQHKHHESRFTVFFEDYWLPKRFEYEKRRAHFSSLIMTSQMTRDEALKRILKPEFSDAKMKKEIDFVCHKLEISREELAQMFDLPKNTYRNFKK